MQEKLREKLMAKREKLFIKINALIKEADKIDSEINALTE